MILKSILQFYISIAEPFYLVLLLGAAIGILLFFIKFKFSTASMYGGYVLMDILLATLPCVIGNSLLYATSMDLSYPLSYIWVPAVLVILFVMIRSFKKKRLNQYLSILTILIMAIISLVIVSQRPRLILEEQMFLIFVVLRVISFLFGASLFSDFLLFFVRKKWRPDKNVMRGRTPKQREMLEQEFARCFGDVVVFLLAMTIFFIPSSMNYVNASDYAYGDVLTEGVSFVTDKWRERQNQDSQIADNQGSSKYDSALVDSASPSEQVQPMLAISKNQVLDTAEIKFDHALFTETHRDWNQHSFPCTIFHEQEYDVEILNTVLSACKQYKVNPAYLFRHLVRFSGTEMMASDFIVQYGTPYAEVEAIQREGMDDTTYMEQVIDEILKGSMSLSGDEPSLSLGKDAVGVYYTYLAVCDESTVTFITLYLGDQESRTALKQVDYSLVQFTIMEEDADIIYVPDYESGLERSILSVVDHNMKSNGKQIYGAVLTGKNENVFYHCVNGFFVPKE